MPGVSHSKYTWLPFVAALRPLPFKASAVGECEHVEKKMSLSLMDCVAAWMSSIYVKCAGSEKGEDAELSQQIVATDRSEGFSILF